MKKMIVVGGGASGLAAAIAAAENGASVCILERLPRVGKKLLLTGNGKCNLSNITLSGDRYHGSVRYAHILHSFDAEQYFRNLGLFLRTDSEGRQYPMSMTAASVLDALRIRAEALNVRVFCEVQVTGLSRTKKGWCVHAAEEEFHADAVIFAAGGSAAPNLGTDGSLLPVLAQYGHQIIKPRPAICSVHSDAERLRPLRGVRVRAEVSAVRGGNVLKAERGEVQFNDDALSGICVMNLARLASLYGKRLTLRLNLLPEIPPQTLPEIIALLIAQRGLLPASELLTGLLPKRVGERIIKETFGHLTTPAAALIPDTDAAQRLCAALTAWEFPVLGTAGFDKAQVTAGGIAGECVSDTLESKAAPGLYFCGEILDLDGDCGGYNLAWAWASGTWAGRHAAGQ